MELDVSWITPSLAIGAHFASEHTALLAREHRVGAVVDLRNESCDDEALLVEHGIAFLHLPTPDMHGSTTDMLRDGVAFVTAHASAGRRVLVHCQHGIGRSALLVLCVLVHQGHAPIDALALAKERRAKVSPSQHQFEAWTAWLRAHASSVRIPTYEEFGTIAYRHLRT